MTFPSVLYDMHFFVSFLPSFIIFISIVFLTLIPSNIYLSFKYNMYFLVSCFRP